MLGLSITLKEKMLNSTKTISSLEYWFENKTNHLIVDTESNYISLSKINQNYMLLVPFFYFLLTILQTIALSL